MLNAILPIIIWIWSHVEFWYARDLMPLLGYGRWENFAHATERAMESCKSSGINVLNHFREVTKMVNLGSDAKRKVKDFMLTRYACYLIAQNGDPSKAGQFSEKS